MRVEENTETRKHGVVPKLVQKTMSSLLKLVLPAIVAKGGTNSFAKLLYSQYFAVELANYVFG